MSNNKHIAQLKNILMILIVLVCFNKIHSQNIAINTTGALADPSALIDISATNKGFLMPRVALTGLTDNTTITAPDEALLVYNTASAGGVWPGFYYWDNNFTIWVRVAAGYGGGFSWNTSGNRGTSSSINFVGTTDDFDFYFRTNNINRLVLESNRLRFLNNGNSMFIGQSAGSNDDLSDNYNIGIGYFSMNTSTTSEYSIGIGDESLRNYSAAGGTSIGVGADALKALTSGTNNVGVGSSALSAVTTGSYNTLLGNTAGFLTTGNDNIGIASMAKTVYSRNVLLGGIIYPNGDDNIGIGHQAFNTTTGITSRSIGIGTNALKNSASATDNIAIGYKALNFGANLIKGYNVAVGAETGGNSTYEGGVFIGYQAGAPTANNLLYIDNSSAASPLIYGNFSARRVGIGRVASANNFELSGTASKAAATGWVANSDKRIKTNITDIDNALETIKKLRPVTFRYTEYWKERNPYIKQHDHVYYNYIAQEYKKVFPDDVKGSGEYLPGDKKEILQVDTYSAQIVLIKAIQEQQLMLEQLQKEIDYYKSMQTENVEMSDALNKKISEIEKMKESIKAKNTLTAQKY